VGYDRKYGDVHTEHGDIPKTEPVLIIRGRDNTAQVLIGFYHSICRLAGSPPEHLQGIIDALTTFADWQATNKVQAPLSLRLKGADPITVDPGPVLVVLNEDTPADSRTTLHLEHGVVVDYDYAKDGTLLSIRIVGATSVEHHHADTRRPR
jgi:hypothetical protein